MRRYVIPSLVAIAAVLVVAAAAVASGPADELPRVPVVAPTSPAPTPTVTPTPAPTPDPPVPTDPPTEVPVPGPTDQPTDAPTDTPTDTPDRTPVDVAAVQQRLTELGYYVGAIDGRAGPATTAAVMAFQKVNRLAVDGVVGAQTLAALADPVTPDVASGPPTRVVVDLDLQVLHLVVDGVRVRTLPVSSGNGENYRTADGGWARALTPTGTFTVIREISGVRHAPLGALYNPKYFHGGFAIHGSPSVPAYPASHGCVRVTIADSVWLFSRVPVGTTVVVHGGTHTFAVPQA